MSESTFTTSQATAIGRVRGLVGDREQGSYLFTDAQIQTYIDTTATEVDAAIGLAKAIRAYHARRISVLVAAPSPDNVKIADSRAITDAYKDIIKDLQASAPSTVELPKARFGVMGAHPSTPRRWGR